MSAPTFSQWRESIICRQQPKSCKGGSMCYPSSTDLACIDCYKADMQRRQHNIAEGGKP